MGIAELALIIALSQGGDALPERRRLELAEVIEQAAAEHDVDPLMLVAVIAHESKWDADSVLPGCPRRGQRPRWCNSDGRPDVGLCQLHIGPSWQPLTEEQALDPAQNIMRCAEELAEARRIHERRGCDRPAHRKRRERRPWTRHAAHHWVQHVNMNSRGYGARVLRRHQRLKRLSLVIGQS